MIPLELNIEKISRISDQKENENYRFRSFLKGRDSKKVDKIVHRLNWEIEKLIDCRDCGNCCKYLRPCVTVDEVDKLSKIENLSSEDFNKNFIETDDLENIKYLKDTPCKFLEDKKCTIYTDRPEDCKSYPHLHKVDFASRTFEMIENCGICPIVFNVFERLKMEFRFIKI
jgi:Fe-S-cluster containining protein